MKIKSSELGIVMVLDRGERVMESLTALAKGEKIPSGLISGIGAVMNTRMGFYHLHRKSYAEKTFKEEMELVSLSGNISWLNAETPIVHCHIVTGDTEFRAHAGHLFEAEVAVTVELIIRPLPQRLIRTHRPEIGLNLIDCAL